MRPAEEEEEGRERKEVSISGRTIVERKEERRARRRSVWMYSVCWAEGGEEEGEEEGRARLGISSKRA